MGVKAHVLRYWEDELGVLMPMKTRGAHRQYRRRDVEIALRVRAMLQEEGLTLSGVKKRLREEGALGATKSVKEPVDSPRNAELRLRAALLELRATLVAIADSLAPPAPLASLEADELDEEPALVLSPPSSRRRD